MNDFASTAMVRVLLDGMRLLGLEPPGPALNPPCANARLPIDLKRQLVAWAVSQGGLSCLALLGRGFHQGMDDPLHRALVRARNAADLLQRWCRLERYVHSHHHTDVVELHAVGATLRHVSLRPGVPPSAAEDLVVLGVLLALLEAIGLHGVRACIAGHTVYPKAEEASLRQLAAQGRTATWQLQWEAPAPEDALSNGSPRQPAGGPPTELCAPLPWPELAHCCATILLGDLLHRRTVVEVARAAGTSPRSLQRALAAAGLSYSAVLGEARLRAAAWWLMESPAPIAEIGFMAGYSDQAHFTRDFSRRIGLPPGRYRADFAV